MSWPGWQVAAAGLGVSLAIALLAWLASLARRDASLTDRVWSLMVAGPGVVAALALPAPAERGLVMLGLALAWAVRLAAHLTRRNWGHGEDRRYQAIRARNEPHFAFKSLYLVFLLQGVLAWVVAMPLLAGLAGPAGWHGLDGLGLVLAVGGLACEAIADAQLARFQADPSQHGRVLDCGLWRYSRHPNYFGECCVWWGLGVMAVAAGGWWALVSPLLMTVLLLRVSGVALLEQGIVARRPGYADYAARTQAFVPGPPMRGRV